MEASKTSQVFFSESNFEVHTIQQFMEFLKLNNIRCLVYELDETLNIYMLLSDIKELKIQHRQRTKQLPY